MKKIAYLALAAATCGLAACSSEDPVTTNPTTPTTTDTSGSSSSADTSSSSSSSSTSDYVNTDPTTIDFSNDYIANNFSASNTVTITFNASGDASVDQVLSGDTITVNGNYVTVNAHNSGTIFKLTGTTTSGAILITSEKKFELNLSSVAITNPNGSAINIQDGHCFVVVDGSNTLADASSSAYNDDYSDGAKSVFHSEDKLRFSGSGSLTITANNAEEKHALSSDDWIFVNGPTITTTAGSGAGQGIKVNDGFNLASGTVKTSAANAGKKGINSEAFVYVQDGTLTASASGAVYYVARTDTTGAAGVKADGYVTVVGGSLTTTATGAGGKGISSDYIVEIKGGTVTATTSGAEKYDVAPKGIKADGGILISGGTVSATSKNHEAIESKSIIKITDGIVYAQGGDDAINSSSDMTISGGYVYAYSTGNDGLDANGNMYLQGGVVMAFGSGEPESGIDVDESHYLYITGGEIFAIGGKYDSGRGMQASQTALYTTMAFSSGQYAVLGNGSSYYWAVKFPTSYTNTSSRCVLVSSPSLTTSCSLYKYGASAVSGTAVNNYIASPTVSGSATATGTFSSNASSSSQGGMGGGGGMGGWR